METVPKDLGPCLQRGAQFPIDRTSPYVPNDGSQKNNKLAFEESVRAITSLYEGLWHGKQEVVVEDALELTMAVSPAPPNRKETLMYLFRRLS